MELLASQKSSFSIFSVMKELVVGGALGGSQRLMEGAVYQLMPTQWHQGFPNSVKGWKNFPPFLLGGKNLRRSDFDHWRRNLWWGESSEKEFFQVPNISDTAIGCNSERWSVHLIFIT